MIETKSKCHVRIHDNRKYVMSIDLDVSIDEVVSVLMKLNARNSA